MARNSRGDKEYTRLQETLHENKRLKRENDRLRKQLARLDLDRMSYVSEIVQEHLSQEEETTTKDMLQSLKNTWKCNDCNSGFLEIVLYNKIGQTFYFRECGNCQKRTKSQAYNPDEVKGILRNEKIEESKKKSSK